jgi:hypothetical protein
MQAEGCVLRHLRLAHHEEAQDKSSPAMVYSTKVLVNYIQSQKIRSI